MRKDDWRGQPLAAAALGDVVIMAEVDADSTGTVGTPPSPVGKAANFTSPNGDGHSEVDADSGTVTQSLSDPLAVVSYTGNGDTALVTGYIQSATAGRGVVRITSNQAFTYTGTGSTLVSGATDMPANTLFIAANSVTMTTGTLTALGAGSRALDVNATGGTGSGGINVTVNGDILSSAGRAIVLDQNDDAATANVVLTSTAGSTITSGAGNAVTIQTEGTGTITVDLDDSVSATGGDAIVVRDTVRGGDISVTVAAVSALSDGDDAIDVQSASTSADVTIVAQGAINAGSDGVVAFILNPTATGNISVTTHGAINAGHNGIDAVNSGTGTVTVNATGTVTATTGGDGILAVSSGGAITVTAANVLTANAEQGIDLQQTDASGTGALSVTASGDISGTDGIRALNSGTGSVTIAASGNVTGIVGDAINIVSTNAAAGGIGVTTAAGEVLRASSGSGIDITTAGTGNVTVNNAAAITSDGAGANTLVDGIRVGSTGTGSITIDSDGAIGTAGDRAQENGINLSFNNAASAGTLSVTGAGAIFSTGNGIDLFTNGTGVAAVDYDGAINSAGGHGIQVNTTSGAIIVTNGGAITSPSGNGIETLSTTGHQTVTVDAVINSGSLDGVHAVSTSGNITVHVNGGNVTGGDDAVDVSSNGAKTINVAAGRAVSGGDLGIASTGTGATTINNSGTITGTTTAIRSQTSATTVNNLAGGTINGAVLLSGQTDTVTNAGTITGQVNLGAGDDLYDGRNGSISGTISGSAGNDTIRGGAGAETISGGVGADILEGNGGSDSLTGGADGDTFRGAAAGLNGDTITDFVAGDRILISDASLAGFSFSLNGNTLTYSGGTLTLSGFSGQLQASAAAEGGVQLTVVGAPVNEARNDFNRDGRSDILWRHDEGLVTNWLANPNGSFANNYANLAASVPVSWQIVGTGDFNGDNRADILWRNNDGTLTNWLAQPNGSFIDNYANAANLVTTNWQVVGVGDFNGDGRDDILWRNETGVIADWLGEANGGFARNFANSAAEVSNDWDVVGIGDFNGDGMADILWRHTDGTIVDWLGQDNGGFARNFANSVAATPTSWEVVGTGDFNGDGNDDILWRHESGLLTNWLGEDDGGFAINDVNAAVGVPTQWHVVQIGDFNGDGKDDVLWRHDNGVFEEWLGSASGALAHNPANVGGFVPNEWEIQAPDINLV